jgi:hypothetical protein
MEKKEPLKSAGALWLKQAKNGSQYFTGVLEDGRKILVFVNQYKQNDTHPDYKIFFDNKPPAIKTTQQNLDQFQP